MVRSTLLGLAAGACCVAALYHRRAGSARVAPRGRGLALALLLLAALAAHAELLLSVATSSVAANRAVVSYVEESTKLIRMQVEEKLIRAGDSLDSTSHSHEITNLGGGEENTNTNNATTDYPTRGEDEAAPPPAGWRSFSFPSDLVLLLGCSDDEFTVRIMPRAEAMEQDNLRQASGDLPDGCLRPEFGTLSNYNRHPYYYALFWSLPGEEKLVPVPVMAVESEVALVMEEAPGSFVLNADVVAFYRPIAGRSEVLVRPRNKLGFMPVSNVEKQGQALRPLHPHTIISPD